MLWLFILAMVWTFVVTYQTKSIVKSQYLKAIGSEIAICVCWFLSLDMIITNNFKMITLLVYTIGCVIGVILGIWLHNNSLVKRR